MTDKIYDIILFHYPCQDGLSSAWVVYRYLYEYHKDKQIELYPIQYGKTINLERLTNKRVIFCDYAPSKEVLEQIETVVSHIKILDHHISSQKALVDKPYAIFDMTKSGVGLTWEYFFSDKRMPKFLRMIQDRDLWTWKIENSREFTSGFTTVCSSIEMYDFNQLFELFNELYEKDKQKFQFYIELGEIMNKSTMLKCKYIALDHLKKINHYKGYNVCVVNCSSELSSDLGNILASSDGVDFAALWRYNHAKEEYYVSLRSDNKADVSLIAKEFGGGGHKNASGFATKINPIILFLN
jgi:oligoribonuclease NrnB/cAMP/cGMP phosphodiesterase (DHH superfamily)